MREIKFRAWDKNEKGMRKVISMSSGWQGKNGWFLTVEKLNTQMINGVDEEYLHQYNLNIKDSELMQFTGLKDKNGKEIYEGDILEGTMLIDDLEVGMTEIDFCELVEWQEDTSCYWCGSTMLAGLNEQAFIIGNIYEHDYLLDNNQRSIK